MKRYIIPMKVSQKDDVVEVTEGYAITFSEETRETHYVKLSWDESKDGDWDLDIRVKDQTWQLKGVPLYIFFDLARLTRVIPHAQDWKHYQKEKIYPVVKEVE